MSAGLIGSVRELARRRQALVARAAGQRAQLQYALQPAVRRLGALDRFVARVSRWPLAVPVAVLGLVVLGPRRLLRGALRALPFLALLRRV